MTPSWARKEAERIYHVQKSPQALIQEIQDALLRAEKRGRMEEREACLQIVIRESNSIHGDFKTVAKAIRNRSTKTEKERK